MLLQNSMAARSAASAPPNFFHAKARLPPRPPSMARHWTSPRRVQCSKNQWPLMYFPSLVSRSSSPLAPAAPLAFVPPPLGLGGFLVGLAVSPATSVAPPLAPGAFFLGRSSQSTMALRPRRLRLSVACVAGSALTSCAPPPRLRARALGLPVLELAALLALLERKDRLDHAPQPSWQPRPLPPPRLVLRCPPPSLPTLARPRGSHPAPIRAEMATDSTHMR